MRTLLMCQSDSIVTKVCGSVIPVIQETYEAGTNWANVEIANTICCSLVLIVAICVLGFLAWRLIDHHAKKNADVRKSEWEKEECTRKQEADRENRLNMLEDEKRKRTNMLEDEKRKRTNMLEDEERKIKSDILYKKLQILCATCCELSKDEPKRTVRKYDDEAVKYYIAALDDAMGIKSTSKTGTDE